ncbi:zinc-dependent metalloprotease [Jiulongibacter sediminis]|uniref:Glutaminyl-tRNA synthetase n=1 Tax=Jiulongibacter sediminis TaxID=1605367 RepID=A0A0P7C491_9BACT|nr:zinc-dependent metalloprotease [Jiulongibacter sediminis]KPM48025.1 glutaminyl-tRNA synthetase [Jiulongibacter sediminis]TBX24205.1 glutaminyl-tRNA synthetase [Jiulongibacter sediminis]
MNKSRLMLVFLLCTLTVFGAEAQRKEKKKKKKDESAVAVSDSTTKKEPEKKEKKGPKAFSDFIDSTAVSQTGLYGVHFKDDKWFFEIADSLLGREIMTISRYSQTAAGGSIYGGELVNRQVVKWEKGPKDKLFLRSISYVIMSPDSTKPIATAVKNSSADPIVGAFEIKAIKDDTVNGFKSYVIDVTSTFEGDEQIFSLDPTTKQRLNITSLKSDRSFISSIKTYPINTEIKTVKTYGVTPPRISLSPSPSVGRYLPASRDAGVVTMEFNNSMVLLPKVPMRKRLFDARVGYFANQYGVFEEESQKADTDVFAVRWRLEPKSTLDAARQQKGELIEPAKPIVYYIDPATPDKWKPYIKQGIDDWSVAFEGAGWKNAIRGEYWPEDDTTMSLEDARFSVVRYFASPISNAYGPNVHDPRSGEIIESHIGWYHNVMRLLRNWYLVQTAAVDPQAREMEFDDRLMGELIRFVSSHEVGHTLGLRHNMGASSATPVEKLRDNDWLTANGHTSSIMDYARFNYVAQPEDSIAVENLFPGIGAYDKWAIKWGYSYIPETENEDQEKLILNEWTKEAYENPALHFGTEISPYDPRYQTEDLGDNAMKASEYGIRNLKRILPNLEEWSTKDAESYKELKELNDAVASQYRRYMGHVLKNIGGVYDSPKTYDMDGSQFEVVPKSTQKEAVDFINKQLFDSPIWLFDENIYAKTKAETGVEALKSLQSIILNQVLSGERMARMLEYSALSAENYSVDELLTDMEKEVLKEVRGRVSADIYRRNLQKVYVSKLIDLLEPDKAAMRSIPVGITAGYDTRIVDLSETDIPSIARGHLIEIQRALALAVRVSDKLTRYHYQDLQKRIEQALDPQ